MAAADEVEMFGYRVVAAVAQRLAAQQAPTGQQASTPWTEAHDRDPCIIGAAGVESAARPQQRTQPALVESQQEQYQSSHGIHAAGTACGM
jgi:hypothetical protein